MTIAGKLCTPTADLAYTTRLGTPVSHFVRSSTHTRRTKSSIMIAHKNYTFLLHHTTRAGSIGGPGTLATPGLDAVG